MHIDKYGIQYPDAYAARTAKLGGWTVALLAAGLLTCALLGCGTSPEPAEPQITDAQFEAIVQNSCYPKGAP